MTEGSTRTKRHETLKRKVDEKEHLKIYGGLREGIGMKTNLHGPMGYVEVVVVNG